MGGVELFFEMFKMGEGRGGGGENEMTLVTS